MPTEVVLPRLNKVMTEGTVLRWLKKNGDEVSKGEPIALVDTEKASVELNAPESGVLSVRATEGAVAKVGSVIALIISRGEEVPQDARPETSNQGPNSTATAAPLLAQAGGKQQEPGLILASPSARRLARELMVELTDVQGSGPGGRIVAEDVASYARKTKIDQAASPPGARAAEGLEIELTGWRRVMAERMAESVRTAAQVTTVAEVDATELVSLRKKLASMDRYRDSHVTFTTFVVKTVADVLGQYRIVNSSLIDDKIIIHSHVNIGIAVAIETGGLVVPVLHDADKKDVLAIAIELEELSAKARGKKLNIHDVSDGTFTITNPGMMGMVFDTPLVVVPQCAILAIGAITKRAAVVDDQIVIRHMMYLSLTYDHRILEGHIAVRFLQRIRYLIEHPQEVIAVH